MMKHREKLKAFVSAVAILTIATHIYAAIEGQTDYQSKKIESVLDKLESQFLDKEASPITYEEQSKDSNKKAAPIESIQIKNNGPIIGKSPNHRTLEAIQEKINEYELQVEALEEKTRRIKTETMDQSNRDSNLSLDLINTQENSLSLKSLTVKMNGSLLYNQIDHSGMWLPNSTLPLYNGPIQPGNHALDFTIVVATIKEQGLPLHGWSTQEITRKMQVEIPEGKSSRQIKILLKKESNNQISAELQDMIDGNNSNKKALK